MNDDKMTEPEFHLWTQRTEKIGDEAFSASWRHRAWLLYLGSALTLSLLITVLFAGELDATQKTVCVLSEIVFLALLWLCWLVRAENASNEAMYAKAVSELESRAVEHGPVVDDIEEDA